MKNTCFRFWSSILSFVSSITNVKLPDKLFTFTGAEDCRILQQNHPLIQPVKKYLFKYIIHQNQYMSSEISNTMLLLMLIMPAPSKGWYWTLRGWAMALPSIHLAPLGGARYLYLIIDGRLKEKTFILVLAQTGFSFVSYDACCDKTRSSKHAHTNNTTTLGWCLKLGNMQATNHLQRIYWLHLSMDHPNNFKKTLVQLIQTSPPALFSKRIAQQESLLLHFCSIPT